MKEIFLFASVISATDTVAALTFVKESSEPKLFAVLFGEGVLNDAVCIVLYRIIKTFNHIDEGKNYLNNFKKFYIFFVKQIKIFFFSINKIKSVTYYF